MPTRATQKPSTDVVTVPNLSEHLASAETTSQLSARFGYAAAMTSINNLLLLGDGETWNRQRVDFAGLPEMVRTFLQAAAGAADIPVTRLLGQSPAGLSATGDSDTRNDYDMIAARQEGELRPALERLDRLIAASEGIDPGALDFAFRPLWQLDAPTAASVALQKAQATAVYAGLKLWPAETTARLVEAQLAEDGTYPNAAAVFAEAAEAGGGAADPAPTLDFDPSQPRDPQGRWTAGAGGAATSTPPSDAPLDPAAPREPIGLSPSADPTSPDPVVEAITRQAVVTLAPLLVASSLRQRAAEFVSSLVRNLSNWLPTGPPRDPPPSAEPAGSGGRAFTPTGEPLPRPLTIHGGLPQLGPAGTGYSYSEQAGDPATAGPRKAVWAIEIPSGLTVPVKSGKPTEEGKEYEGGVRKELQFGPAPKDYELGGKMPDG